jgi:hypothetical protein
MIFSRKKDRIDSKVSARVEALTWEERDAGFNQTGRLVPGEAYSSTSNSKLVNFRALQFSFTERCRFSSNPAGERA